MPSANPRINTVLERPVYMAIRSLARREGLSLSAMVRRLVHEALELREDAALEALVERRARTSAPGLERKARRVFGRTTPPPSGRWRWGEPGPARHPARQFRR
jgi:hypothetical protein